MGKYHTEPIRIQHKNQQTAWNMHRITQSSNHKSIGFKFEFNWLWSGRSNPGSVLTLNGNQNTGKSMMSWVSIV